MLAHEYPISLGFKAVYLPYYGPGGTIFPGHHGIDWACPTGTEVRVGGTLIGLSGATGTVSGPHLHVDRSIDGSRIYANYRSPRYYYKISGVVTFAGPAGTAGNMVVIRADDGDTYRLLHLSVIKVKVGQKVGSNMKISMPQGRIAWSEVLGRPLARTHKGEFDADIVKHAGDKSWSQWLQQLWSSKEAEAYRGLKVKALAYYSKKDVHDSERKMLQETVISRDAEIEALKKENATLKAQCGDSGKWETLRALLRELFGIGGTNGSN